MAVLHNRVSQKELKELLYAEVERRITLSFYEYVTINDTASLRAELYVNLNSLKVFGRIYIATEGVNAQLSVPVSNYQAMENYLRSIPFFQTVRINIAVDDANFFAGSDSPTPECAESHEKNIAAKQGRGFWVLKIKIRDKIVADGISEPNFSMKKKGKYLNAAEFNRLADNPETVIVDMRNHYEYEVGHFENAIEIPSDTFREQLPMAVNRLEDVKERNIIMYCTGGIRCEKASAFLLHNGFKNVFHLEGGIIHYTNTVKKDALPNKFRGKNFVFDDRLGEQVGNEVISVCHQCGKACDAHTNCVNSGCHLLFIQCKNCAEYYKGCCSDECKTICSLPQHEQKNTRKGIMKGMMVFNKSRRRVRQELKHN